MKGLNLACVADVIQPLLVTSAKHRRDPCSGPPRDSTNNRKCVSKVLPFILTGKIHNGVFHAPITVHRWEHRSLSTDVSERSTSIGSEPFSLLIYLDAIKFAFAKYLYLLKRQIVQEFVQNHGRRVQNLHFRFTCVARKRHCLKSLIWRCFADVTN